MAEDVPAEEILTLLEVRDAFDIKERTLYGWLREAKIQSIWVDGKNKGITRTQFNQLAFAHRRIPRADISAADWAVLLARVARLEHQVTALQQARQPGTLPHVDE